MYKSVTDLAKDTRTLLKKAYGITSRQVSIRARHHTSLEISIHDPSIDIKEVENAARKHESIQRCEFSGEILSGGNTFVFIEYSDRAVQAVLEEHSERISSIVDGMRGLKEYTGDTFGGIFVTCISKYEYHIKSKHDTYDRYHANADHPSGIALALLKMGNLL